MNNVGRILTIAAYAGLITITTCLLMCTIGCANNNAYNDYLDEQIEELDKPIMVYNFYVDSELIWFAKVDEIKKSDFNYIWPYVEDITFDTAWYYMDFLRGGRAWFVNGHHLVIIQEEWKAK